MWTRSEVDEIRAILDRCIDDADAEIIDAIRRNQSSRDDLLGQLDGLDKVRERLHVRFERFASGDDDL